MIILLFIEIAHIVLLRIFKVVWCRFCVCGKGLSRRINYWSGIVQCNGRLYQRHIYSFLPFDLLIQSFGTIVNWLIIYAIYGSRKHSSVWQHFKEALCNVYSYTYPFATCYNSDAEEIEGEKNNILPHMVHNFFFLIIEWCNKRGKLFIVNNVAIYHYHFKSRRL